MNSNSAADSSVRDGAFTLATSWFREVEQACNRFDATSELRKLCETTGTPVHASELLFEAVQFAVAVADASGGAFDPTLGAHLESRGFDREYRNGEQARSAITPNNRTTYRDVELDETNQTITLHQSLLLDLGAVAKGLAIDLAARELTPLGDFLIDAGGDLYACGHNAEDAPWRVGIRHPRALNQTIRTVEASNTSVCTSGDYERVGTHGQHHILDARGNTTASELASVTVIAPSAMVADALATAAFALGPSKGLAFLQSHNVQALMITPALEVTSSHGWTDGV